TIDCRLGIYGKRSALAARPRREDGSPPGQDADLAVAWFTTAVPKGAHCNFSRHFYVIRDIRINIFSFS
ncbi:hypothetical protein, partial [Pseudomonas viridiflava]|uniref:hypothetical protein n=1 Tax=Pseudomonas viridiflava TaxID=33069 RepID=UPI00197CE78B